MIENLAEATSEEGSSDRTFGLVFAIAFGVIGFISYIKPLLRHTGEPRVRAWALVVASMFLIVSLARPVVLHPLNKAWTKFGFLLQKITNPIVMGAVFYLLITPIALFFRMTGRDPMRRRFDRETSSYWIARQTNGVDPNAMKNPF